MNALPEGAIPRTRAARQFVNSFNSLLRRLRPTNELRRSPQPRCKNSINSNPRRERPERAASPEPRATPWVSAYKRLRPVRAKVWANGWLLLLPLQGVGNGDMAPRALPWAGDLLGFQPAQGRRQGFFRTISTYLIFLDFERPYLSGPLAAQCRLNVKVFGALRAPASRCRSSD